MNRLVILFGLVIGFASSITIKNELLQTLLNCEGKLLKAIDNSTNHGLNYHRKVYEDLLTQVQKEYKDYSKLPDNITRERIPDYVAIVNEFNTLVDASLQNVNPHETTKAQAIYIMAMIESCLDKVPNSCGERFNGFNMRRYSVDKCYADVIKIIDMEIYIAKHPTFILDPNSQVPYLIRDSLKLAYSWLEKFMAEWNVPLFEDFYKLANQTREIIAKRNHENSTQVENFKGILKQFDNLTILMANEWPINSNESVDYYYTLSKDHYHTYVLLEIIQEASKPLSAEVNQEEEESLVSENDKFTMPLASGLIDESASKFSQIDTVFHCDDKLPELNPAQKPERKAISTH